MSDIGRDESFQQEFQGLHRRAYQTAYRLCGDRSASEELAQEVLTRAYVHWDRLDDRREGWVVTTAVRLTISRWRKTQRRGVHVSSASDPAVDSLVAQRLDLMRLVAALPRRQREVVALRYLEDRSEQEVADLLGCSVGSVKRHASRGRAALRAVLDRPLSTTPVAEVR